MTKNFVFIVFSNYNYKEHKYNILKECLQSWVSGEKYKFTPNGIDIKYIYTNPKKDDKMFIVSTSKDWLKSHNLESIINDDELFATSTYLYTL